VAHEALLQPTAGTGISLEEWAALLEDEPGELADGCLEEEEAPDLVHEVLVVALSYLLRTWLRPRGGLVAGSETKLAVSERRGRKPDATQPPPFSLRLSRLRQTGTLPRG